MKYVVIAALFALLLLLLYSRVYPYIQFLKKILGAAKTMGDSPRNPRDAFRGASPTPDRKLVRCVSCGTWIPGERAIAMRAGSSVYCSRECLEKSTAPDKRKAAS